jgi:hypothetical protein
MLRHESLPTKLRTTRYHKIPTLPANRLIFAAPSSCTVSKNIEFVAGTVVADEGP